MRTGPFWDFVEGRSEPPPIAAMLGFDLVSVDPEAMTIEVAFTARPEFLNPVGHVQGGMLCAMLDDTMGPALVATLGEGEWAPTTDLHVQFLAPAKAGRLIGRGRVTRKGGAVAFLSGELRDADDRIVATGVATATIRRSPGGVPASSA